MTKRTHLFSVPLFALSFATPAFAMQDQAYGLGGISTGRVGSVTADVENPFATLLNPALLSAMPGKRFSAALTSVNARLENPTNVMLDNRDYRTRDGQLRVGEAQLPRVETSLWSAGYAHPFELGFWPQHRAGFGLAVSGPFNQFRRWLALSPYDFTPLRYGGADTQFKGTVGMSLELIPGALFVGGGLSLFLTSAGTAETVVTSANPTGRLAMDVGFNTSPLVGLYTKLGTLSGALVYRQAVNPVFHQTMIAQADLGGANVANQPLAVQSSLYYEPGEIELELQNTFRSGLVISAGLAFQQWSRYQPRYLTVSTRNASGRSVATNPPLVRLRDTLNPRASIEWRGWQRWRFAGGYEYRPNAVIDISGSSNLIDTDTHVAGLSLQREVGRILFLEKTSLNVYGQLHVLNPLQVTKTDSEFVGAPGYTIRGQALVLGASLTADL